MGQPLVEAIPAENLPPLLNQTRPPGYTWVRVGWSDTYLIAVPTTALYEPPAEPEQVGTVVAFGPRI